MYNATQSVHSTGQCSKQRGCLASSTQQGNPSLRLDCLKPLKLLGVSFKNWVKKSKQRQVLFGPLWKKFILRLPCSSKLRTSFILACAEMSVLVVFLCFVIFYVLNFCVYTKNTVLLIGYHVWIKHNISMCMYWISFWFEAWYYYVVYVVFTEIQTFPQTK